MQSRAKLTLLEVPVAILGICYIPVILDVAPVFAALTDLHNLPGRYHRDASSCCFEAIFQLRWGVWLEQQFSEAGGISGWEHQPDILI